MRTIWLTSETGFLKRGFISDYSQHSHQEDFAEMVSVYVTNTPEQWNAWMTEAGSTGKKLINQKLDVVREYLNDKWGIDLDQMRSTILARENDVVNGDVDLDDLTY